MKTKTSHQRIAFGLFTILIPLVFLVAGVHPVTAQRGNPACPPPFAKVGGQCVLTADAPPLEHTLTLADNTKLNCRGRKLVPQTTGTGAQRSTPEVAIFLNGAKHVRIQNCVIENFDFGIFAINSKLPSQSGNAPAVPTNQVLENTIKARFVGISLMSVDNTEIRSNDLTTMTKGGRALYVGRDSDRNRILNNRFTAANSLVFADEAFRVPGPKSDPSGANPPSVGSAVLITQTEGAEPTLLNAIIDGRLFQLTVANSAVPDQRFSEGNTFTGNTVTISGAQPVDGVVVAIAQGTVVSNNKVVGAKNSIRIGLQTGIKKKFPGKCQSKPSRLCLDDNDCRIPGFDTPTPDTCTNAPQTTVSWVSVGNIIQNNMIHGPFDAGIGTLGQDTTITGNTIIGPLRTDPSFPLTGSPVGGIVLVGKFALGTTTVTRNTVRRVAIALTLSHAVTVGPPQPGALATEFKAKISLNDFTGYSTAVLLVKGNTAPLFYNLFPTELSVNGSGNYWGIPCPLGFKPGSVLHSDGSTQDQGPPPLVNDSHPFGAPVARASPQRAPCH